MSMSESDAKLHNAEVVAEYFHDSYVVLVRNGEPEFGLGVYSLDLVLKALRGETDPLALGMDPDSPEALTLEVDDDV